MTSTYIRCLIALLAALMTGGVVAGCEQDAGWEHPNRQRHPAPPAQTNITMSVEELQREWKEQDMQAARANRELDQDARRAPEGQHATSDMLDVALGHVESALEAALDNADTAQTRSYEQEAIGGGPTEVDTPRLPPASGPPGSGQPGSGQRGSGQLGSGQSESGQLGSGEM